MKIIVDMNLSPRWVGVLAAAGWDATHWSSLGPSNTPDALIMEYARSRDRLILTHDLDFGAILAATHGLKPSVVQIRADDVSPEAIGAIVIAAMRQLNLELDRGALISIDPKRTRVRLLPLR